MGSLREADKDIRERIEALKLALREGLYGSAPSHWRRDESAGTPLAINRLEGAEEIDSDLGRCLVLEKDPGTLIRPGDLRDAVCRLTPGPAPVRAGVAHPRYVFLDLETTGFSSTPLFLAGTLFE